MNKGMKEGQDGILKAVVGLDANNNIINYESGLKHCIIDLICKKEWQNYPRHGTTIINNRKNVNKYLSLC